MEQQYLISYKKARNFLFIYYSMGIAGYSIPVSSSLFMLITPWGLLLNLFLMFYFENCTRNRRETIRFLLFALSIYIFTFSIEYIGVNTGKIFGPYTYETTLGIKFGETPILIGINWIIVFIGLSKLVQGINSAAGRILLTGFSMVLFDFVMEQVAPLMHMWQFNNNSVPMRNYIAWFFCGVFLQFIKEVLKIRFHSKISELIILLQFIFFFAIYVIHYIKILFYDLPETFTFYPAYIPGL